MKKRIPQKNNPHPVEKPSRAKIPDWLSFTRKVWKEKAQAEQEAHEKRGSQVKPKKGD